MLIALFSFNKGNELNVALSSLKRHFPNFDVAVWDDNSTNPKTLRILEKHTPWLKKLTYHTSTEIKGRHGNLYKNMQIAMEYAMEHGYQYLFFTQDDIQVVRTFDSSLMRQYSQLFEMNNDVFQIDPRFVRTECNASYSSQYGGYVFPKEDRRRGYADVGIINLNRASEMGWKFIEGERENKQIAFNKGLIRLFPPTPLVMHIPFPALYRDRESSKSASLISGRGYFKYRDLNDRDIQKMDSREIEKVPHPLQYLRITGIGFLRFSYMCMSDRNIYSDHHMAGFLIRPIRKILSKLKKAFLRRIKILKHA